MNAYLRGNRWSEAEEGLRLAIAANSVESSERINIYGTVYLPYTPHFYRGVALSKLGNRCDEVRSELAISERQGAIKNFAADYATLRQIRDACPPPVRPPVPVPTPVPVSPAPQPGLLSTAEPTTTATGTSTTTGARFPPVPPPSAGPLLVKRQALQDALKAARTLSANQDGATLPRMREPRTKFRDAISAAENALTSTSPASVDGAMSSLNASSNEYRRTLNMQNLAAAIDEYAVGHYDQAVKLLAKPASSDRVYGAQMVLFRAAARYSKYVVDGERNTALRNLALNDVQEYRRLEPNPQLNGRYFSPKFRALVGQIPR